MPTAMYNLLDLIITLRCNLNCINCIEMCNLKLNTGLDYSKSDMTIGQINNLIAQVKSFNHKPVFNEICVTGGEALLHSNVEEITLKLEKELLIPKYINRLTLNSNTIITPPSNIARFVINHSLPSEKSNVHKVCLLHPNDYGGKIHTYESCIHYRKNTIVLTYQGFSICCAGDAFIRLFAMNNLILDKLPFYQSDFPLKEMNKICCNCPFSNDDAHDKEESLLPWERDIGNPVSKIFSIEAQKNRSGRKITKIFPEK